MSWAAVATIGGSVITGLGASSAASKNRDAQMYAADKAYEQSLPWNTSGMFGTATFDPDTRESSMELSPEMQALYDRLYGRADATSAELKAMGTGEDAQRKFYNEQRSLFAPGDARKRLGVENRLRSQGRLATTGGAQSMGEFDYSQQMSDYNRQVDAYDRAQSQIGLLRDREASDLTQAMKVGALPFDYATLGRGIGSGMSGAAQFGQGLMSDAGIADLGASSNFWAGLGKNVQDTDWSGMFGSGNGVDLNQASKSNNSYWDWT
jgi:hypothetical protein